MNRRKTPRRSTDRRGALVRTTLANRGLYSPFILAILIGAGFCAAAWAGRQGPTFVVWKGLGVGLLAWWAARRARSRDGWLIAMVLACGAAGDMLIDALGPVSGAAAFLLGHVMAVTLYRRRGARWSAIAAGATATAIAGWSITLDPVVALYAAGLGAMAGGAIASRFPRKVTLGACLFVISDLLIFARSGPLAGSDLPRLLVWPAYFCGQALIAYGVVAALEPSYPRIRARARRGIASSQATIR